MCNKGIYVDSYRGGTLLDDEGELRVEAFETVMRDQVILCSRPKGQCSCSTAHLF